MADEIKNARIEYLEKQIWLCKQDLELIEECNERSRDQNYEGNMYVWSKTKKRMEKYVEELDLLRNGGDS